MTEVAVIEALFLLAPLAVVPLALQRMPPAEPAWGAILRRVQPACAAPVVLSFLVPPGVPAAALALPWLVWTALLALEGLARLRAPGRDAPTIALVAARLYLPVGGGWLLLSRLGAQPLGFAEPLVLLTAVHFHYAAFATLVLAGLAGREVGATRSGHRQLYRTSVAALIAGPGLLAAGIKLSPALEVAGVLVQVVGVLGLAAVTAVRVLPRLTPRLARGLLGVSTASAAVGVVFALAYGWGEFVGRPAVSIPRMAEVHGVANALGFVLCGLLAWQVAGATRPPASCKEG